MNGWVEIIEKIISEWIVILVPMAYNDCVDYREGVKNEWMSDYNSLRYSIIHGWEVTMSGNINGWVVILVLREYNEWMDYKGRERYKWMSEL